LRDLQSLEQQIGNLRHAATALTRASALGDLLMARRATRDAKTALAAIAVTTMNIRQEVVPSDGFGDNAGSIAELALRATRMVILAAVRELHGSPPFARTASMLQAELDLIPRVWMPYRQDAATANRVLYRAAIRAAQQAVNELGAHPDVVRDLQAAASYPEQLEVRSASVRIMAVLSVSIDAEPDSPLIKCSMSLHAPGERTPERSSARLLTSHAASKS
jgi:hypothetical protein